MATRTFTPTDSIAGRAALWTGLLNGDDGQWFDTQTFRDVSIHVRGTFGVGGTLLWEGTNETTAANGVTLNDPQGNALSFTAEKMEQVLESARWMRPRVSAGDGTTSLQVHLWAGRSVR